MKKQISRFFRNHREQILLALFFKTNQSHCTEELGIFLEEHEAFAHFHPEKAKLLWKLLGEEREFQHIPYFKEWDRLSLEKLIQSLFIDVHTHHVHLEEWLNSKRKDYQDSEFYHVFFKHGDLTLDLSPWFYACIDPLYNLGDIRVFHTFEYDRAVYQSIRDKSLIPLPEHVWINDFVSQLYQYQQYTYIARWFQQKVQSLPQGLQNVVFISLCHLAARAYRSKHYVKAIEMYENAMSIRNDIEKIYYNLAMLYIKLDNYSKARETIVQLVNVKGPSVKAFEFLGDLEFRLGRFEDAETYYQLALEEDDGNEDILRKLEKTQQQKEKPLSLSAPKQDKQNQSQSKDNESQDVIDSVLKSLQSVYPGLPLIGREKEVRSIIEILEGTYKSNVLIVGEPGVGKTALLLEAKTQYNTRHPQVEWYELQLGPLVAGAKYRGQLEERIQMIEHYLKKRESVLVIDHFHQVVPSSSSRAIAQEVSILLRDTFLDGDIKIVATTTPDEFRNSIERDPTIYRCFQVVTIDELTDSEIIQILEHYWSKRAREENIDGDVGLLSQIPGLVRLYLQGRAMPDRALEVVDRTLAHAKYEQRNIVTAEDLYQSVANMAGVPVEYVRNQALMDWEALRTFLRKRIVGQDHVIESVLKILQASSSGLRFHPERPRGVFLFVGPSGVGKTEFARALAECWMGGEDRLIRIDMSEYMERYSVSRLIGASPGYVGYYDPNQLVDRVRQMPFSLILLDEIEKADSSLLHIFLQVFDAGRLTDARGKVAHFNNTVIIMTSNIGTHLYSREPLGYQRSENHRESSVMKELKKVLPPEFLNRVDEIVVFHPLNHKAMRDIIHLKLEQLRERFVLKNVRFIWSDDVVSYFIKAGFHPEYGARFLERTIERDLISPISLLIEKHPSIRSINVVLRNGKPHVEIYTSRDETGGAFSETRAETRTDLESEEVEFEK